jgi:threonine synthase
VRAPASTLTHLECSICGARHGCEELQTVCRSCGRALFARYDLDAASTTLTREALGSREASMWRYAEVMPASELAGSVSLGEGMTPLLSAPRLGAELGCGDLLVKDEGGNPTGSFKARGIAAAMAMARRLGVTDIGMPTAGNAGSAAAAYAAHSGITAHVAMPADTPEAIIREVLHHGADLQLVDGLITDAGRLIAEGCREHGWFEMSTLKEPYRVEGKKTMGYELWEQFDGELPDVVLYPTGGGTGLIGMWKAFEELEAMGHIGSERPRMCVVQSDGCAPIVRAWRNGDERAEPWHDASTVAPGIRVPAPFADDLILRTVRESGGAAVAVPDESIVPAMRRLARAEGIDACPEGAATLVGLELLLAEGAIRPHERIVLFNTGTGLKHPELRPGIQEAGIANGGGSRGD